MERVDEQFAEMTARFDEIDQRFDKAAIRISNIDDCFTKIDERVAAADLRAALIRGEPDPMKWTLGFVLAFQIGMFVKLLIH